MAALMIMLTQQGTSRVKKVLTPVSARAMLTQQYTNHPELRGYGFGFWEDHRYGIHAFSHGGSMAGYGCLLYILPDEELGLFIVYNQESSRLADQVMSKFVRTFLPDRIAAPPLRDRKRDIAVSRFTGIYADNLYNHSRPANGGWPMRPFEIKADKEGNLVFRKQPAWPVDDLLFQAENGLLLAFRADDKGGITHLMVNQTVYERLTAQDLDEYKRKSRPEAIVLGQEVLMKYAGRYSGDEGELILELKSGSLFANLPGRNPIQLSPSSSTSFFAVEGPIRIEFLPGEDRSAGRLILQAGEWHTVFSRIDGRRR